MPCRSIVRLAPRHGYATGFGKVIAAPGFAHFERDVLRRPCVQQSAHPPAIFIIHLPRSDSTSLKGRPWVRLHLDSSPHDDKVEAEEESLKKRMTEFLAGAPSWMMRRR